MTSTMPDRCVRCDRPVFSITDQVKAGPEQRAKWKALGMRRYHGRGLCSACYVYCKKYDELGAYQRRRWFTLDEGPGPGIVPRRASCRRCGIETGSPTRICDDCALVAHDLHESERWTAS